MKKVIIAVGIILVAAAGGAGFFLGKSYAENQASQVQESFFNERGEMTAGQRQSGAASGAPGGLQASDGTMTADQASSTGGFMRGGGTVGVVERIDGDTLTLNTTEEEVTILLTDETRVLQTVAGTIDELQPGARVMVSGETDKVSGELTATQVQIMDGLFEFLEAPAAPAETETEP